MQASRPVNRHRPLRRFLRLLCASFVFLPLVTLAQDLPDCREAFGDANLNVHDGEKGNLNLRDESRVFETTGLGANAGGGSSLNQRPGTACIADDDPTDRTPETCDTFGAVSSWEDRGREFPEPPSDSYTPNQGDLIVGDGQTETIATTDGTAEAYKEIVIENGGHLIIEGDGEVTASKSFTGEHGATLELNGTPIINVDGSFSFGEDRVGGGKGDRAFMDVDSEIADTSDTFAKGGISIENTTVRVTEGTWRPMTMGQGGDINMAGSDLNCDPTHPPGGSDWQPDDVMPDCQDDTGGIFLISRSSGGIEDSAVRGFIYVDGTQFNVDNSLVKGTLTSGGNTLRHADFVPDGIPSTGDFCEERVEGFAFDVGGGEASTCRRHEVGITALNRFDEPLYTFTGTVDLETSSDHGDWFRLDEDGGTGDPGAVNAPFDTGNDDGFGRYAFHEDDLGQISLFLGNVHADDLTVTVTTEDEVPAGETRIRSTSDPILFRDNAFVIDSVDDFGADLIAGRDHLFEATLWQRERGEAGEGCAVPDSYADSSQPVRLWLERHADDPGGAAPEVTAAGTGDTATLGDSDPGSPGIDLDFSDNAVSDPGRARFTLSTTDVGKYALAIRERNSGFAVDESGDPLPIAGGSGDYVARPFGLEVDVEAANPAAEGPSGGVYRDAGEAFDITVRAVAYLAGADGDDNGLPDGYPGLGHDEPSGRADLSSAATVPSFGAEGGSPGEATLAGVLWRPASGDDPGLTQLEPTDSAAFASGDDSGTGTATAAARYGEAGIIVLNAAHDNYLGSGHDLRGGKQDPVGRFIPAELRLEDSAIENRQDLACSPDSDFTYMGEGFRATVSLGAFNRQGGRTRNYDDALGYARLPATELAHDPAGYTDGEGAPIDDLAVEGISADWTEGRASALIDLEVDRDDCPCPRDPYPDLRIGIAPVDADGVSLDTDTYDLPSDVADGDRREVGDTKIRFGRLAVDNAFGSELADLEIPFRAEYWDGSTWRVNDADSCTAVALADEVRLASSGGDEDEPGTETVVLDSGDTNLTDGTEDPLALDGGRGGFVLSAPGEGNTGWVDLTLDLADAYPYLRDDLDADGAFDEDPSARGSFGLYSGDPNRIYLEEVLR